MKRIFLSIYILAIAFFTAKAEATIGYAAPLQDLTLDLGWNGNNYGTIQWQKSTDGINWTDISKATEPVYKVKFRSESYYRAVVKGDKACPEIVAERHIKPLSFTATVAEVGSDNVKFTISGAKLGEVSIAEAGCAAGLSDIARDYTLMARTPDENCLIGSDGNGSLVCSGLRPNQNYTLQPYIKTVDGSLIFATAVQVMTLGGLSWSSENWTIEKNIISARFQADGVTPTDMTFTLTKVGGTPKTYSIIDEGNGKFRTSNARGLTAGTEYELRLTANVDGKPVELTKRMRTMSDYSKVEVDNTVKPATHYIKWDKTNFTQLSPVGMQVEYPRMCRVDEQKLLLTYHGGATDAWKNSYLRKSYDNGNTWSEPVMIFDASKSFLGSGYWRICNPEMTKLQNGWILLSAVANAKPETNRNCKVIFCLSKDGGETWGDPVIVGRGRTWEPQVVQLPNGEIELLVSSEAAWWNNETTGWIDNGRQYQQIVSARSTDFGETWTTFERAAYLPNCRDGMPVSIVMQGNKGVLFSIESVGSGLAPSLIHRTLDGKWDSAEWNRIDTSRRWLVKSLNGGAGAPHMIQLPTGEFLIMAHTNQTGDVWQTCRPQITIADNTGHNFRFVETPFANSFPAGTGVYYNSFFLFDDNTVWLLFTKACYSGNYRAESAIMLMEGKITEQ